VWICPFSGHVQLDSRTPRPLGSVIVKMVPVLFGLTLLRAQTGSGTVGLLGRPPVGAGGRRSFSSRMSRTVGLLGDQQPVGAGDFRTCPMGGSNGSIRTHLLSNSVRMSLSVAGLGRSLRRARGATTIVTSPRDRPYQCLPDGNPAVNCTYVLAGWKADASTGPPKHPLVPCQMARAARVSTGHGAVVPAGLAHALVHVHVLHLVGGDQGLEDGDELPQLHGPRAPRGTPLRPAVVYRSKQSGAATPHDPQAAPAGRPQAPRPKWRGMGGCSRATHPPAEVGRRPSPVPGCGAGGGH
jgi:hypothetical protein